MKQENEGYQVRRSKSEKNFGRMYNYDKDRRSFVSWVDNITQELMNNWWAACPDNEKNYWNQIFSNPTDLQVALDAVPIDKLSSTVRSESVPQLGASAITTSKGHIPPELTYAPYTPTRTLHETTHEDIIKDIESTYGFAGLNQAIDQARETKFEGDYKQLYRDMLFYLTGRAKTNVGSLWVDLIDGFRKVELEKMIIEIESMTE